jgi:hypothetical protein
MKLNFMLISLSLLFLIKIKCAEQAISLKDKLNFIATNFHKLRPVDKRDFTYKADYLVAYIKEVDERPHNPELFAKKQQLQELKKQLGREENMLKNIDLWADHSRNDADRLERVERKKKSRAEHQKNIDTLTAQIKQLEVD